MYRFKKEKHSISIPYLLYDRKMKIFKKLYKIILKKIRMIYIVV